MTPEDSRSMALAIDEHAERVHKRVEPWAVIVGALLAIAAIAAVAWSLS